MFCGFGWIQSHLHEVVQNVNHCVRWVYKNKKIKHHVYIFVFQMLFHWGIYIRIRNEKHDVNRRINKVYFQIYINLCKRRRGMSNQHKSHWMQKHTQYIVLLSRLIYSRKDFIDRYELRRAYNIWFCLLLFFFSFCHRCDTAHVNKYMLNNLIEKASQDNITFKNKKDSNKNVIVTIFIVININIGICITYQILIFDKRLGWCFLCHLLNTL